MSLLSPCNMTANNAPSPFVASSSPTGNSGHEAYRPFAGAFSPSTFWQVTATSGVLEIDLGSGALARTYVVTASTTTARAPKNWTFEGSNDNSTWTTLDTQTNQSWGASQVRGYLFSNVTTYRYYRLNVTANNGDATFLEVAFVNLLSDTERHFSQTDGMFQTHSNRSYYTGPQFSGNGVPITPVPYAGKIHDATFGVAYTETITAQGGSGVYASFNVITGALPTGLTLNTSTGIISGTPTGSPGTSMFTVKVTDSLGQFGSTNFSLVVLAPVITTSASAWIG